MAIETDLGLLWWISGGEMGWDTGDGRFKSHPTLIYQQEPAKSC